MLQHLTPVCPGRSVSTVIIGGGHSGLAMSKRLSDRGIDHVVLERGDIASSWVTQRWDSFTLQTPNWQTRLPGSKYDGDDPDGFMAGDEIAAFLQSYASAVDAPVQAQTTVLAVRPATGGYEVVTDQGTWDCRSVVLASGACNLPSIPAFADGLPDTVVAVNPLEYRRADDLPDGGVLVVGAAGHRPPRRALRRRAGDPEGAGRRVAPAHRHARATYSRPERPHEGWGTPVRPARRAPRRRRAVLRRAAQQLRTRRSEAVSTCNVEVEFDIDGECDEEQKEMLVAAGTKYSAVFDMLANPTEVNVSRGS